LPDVVVSTLPHLSNVRSALFAPAIDERKSHACWTAGADAVILDLEDAVLPAAKEEARRRIGAILSGRARGPLALVRINALDTPEGLADVEALAGQPLDAVVVPKATSWAVELVAGAGWPVAALIESAQGVLEADALARVPGVGVLMLGPVDLSVELGCEPMADGSQLLYARSRLVLASSAAGLGGPLDGPCLQLYDRALLREQSERARRLGFAGKLCVHPSQIACVHESFAPPPAEIEWARSIVTRFEQAAVEGGGVVAIEGSMIDLPVVKRANRILARAGLEV
jgi:citrate lyase subunit beta/citryl-CoA lyase